SCWAWRCRPTRNTRCSRWCWSRTSGMGRFASRGEDGRRSRKWAYRIAETGLEAQERKRIMAMPKISFYQKKRRDGGIRTGIDIDRESVLGCFQSGPEESDPVLLWFVDLRCEGARLPTTPEEARQWLLDHSALIHQAFQKLIAEIRAGIDFNTWPLLWTLP